MQLRSDRIKFANVCGESIYEKWRGRRTKIRRGIIKSRQAGISGEGVTGVALAKTVKKSFGNEREKVER